MTAKKDKEVREFMAGVYDTISGKKSIDELYSEIGLPVAVSKYARFEAKTNSTKKPFVTVERYMDGELRFNNQIIIKGIKKTILLVVPNCGMKIEYVRHPSYNPSKPPMATDKEILEANKKEENR